MSREHAGWKRGATRGKVEEARRLRRNMTAAERAFWELVRRDALGHRVRRQHVLGGWIADFYIPAARLVIEIDGAIHDEVEAHDAHRTEALVAMGLSVLRLRNEDVLRDPGATVARVRTALQTSLDARSAETPRRGAT